MISLINKFSNQILLLILIGHGHKFDFRKFFPGKIVLFLNFIMHKAAESMLILTKKGFVSPNIIFHSWMKIAYTNIKPFLYEIIFMDNISLNMNLRNLKEFRFCIFSLIFIFPLQTFNVLLTLHLNLTIFVNVNMHLGQAIKKKVIKTKHRHAACENNV